MEVSHIFEFVTAKETLKYCILWSYTIYFFICYLTDSLFESSLLVVSCFNVLLSLGSKLVSSIKLRAQLKSVQPFLKQAFLKQYIADLNCLGKFPALAFFK